MDLLNLIKRQALMKKLIKENETLNIPHNKEMMNGGLDLGVDMSEVLLMREGQMDVLKENNNR